MDNLRGLLCIRRMDRIPYARTRELCGVRKVYDKVCGEGLWKVLHEYGVKDYFVRSMSNLYEWSEECGIFGNRIGEW